MAEQTAYEKLKAYRQRNGYAINAKYQKEHTVRFNLVFFRSTDAEVIEKLQSVSNKTDYVRQLILKDLQG